MLSNFIWIGVLLSGSFWGATCRNRKFEEILPVSCMASVILLYLFGFFGQLSLGIVCVLILSIGMYFSALLQLLRTKGTLVSALKNFFTPAFFLFFAFFIILNLCDFNLLATGSDEFSHWMDSVKVMVSLDDFVTNPQSHSLYASYPPAMTLFQYFFQKLYLFLNPGQIFSEWRVYLAYQVFAFSLVLPFVKNLSFKRPMELLLTGIIAAILPTPLFTNFYSSVYIDPFIGILSGCGLAMILLCDRKDTLYVLYVTLVCTILVLAKDVGMYFAFFVALAFFMDLAITCRKEKAPTNKKDACRHLLTASIPFLALLAAKGSWKYIIHISGTPISFGNKIDLIGYTRIFFLNNDSTYRQAVVERFKDAFYTLPVYIGNTNITISFFDIFCITALAAYCLYRKLLKNQPEKKHTISTVFSIALIQLIVYIYCLGATYVSSYSEFEALNIASYERYISISFLTVWVILVYAAMEQISRFSLCEKKNQHLLFFAVCLLIAAPMKNISDFLGRDTVRQSEYVRSQYAELTEKIHTVCDTDDNIYFVAQADDGYSFRTMKFTARPCTIANTTGWSLGRDFYTNDVWSEDLTASEWHSRLLQGYDYVAIYKINDHFIDTFRELFQDPEEIAANSIYIVNKDTGLLEKCA